MRSSRLYFALGVTPLAICAPIPLVLVDTIEAVVSSTTSGSQHPPTTVLSGRPLHALPRIIHWGPDEDDENFETVIDNKPITPSADADPSVVLQAPRPIVTEYLMAISVKTQGDKEKQIHEAQSEDSQAQQVSAEEEQQQQVLVLSPKKDSSLPTRTNPAEGGEGEGAGKDDFNPVAEVDMIIPVATQRIKLTGGPTPCDQQQPKYLSREQSDMIIICLAVVFLFAVVLLETFGSFSRRRREGSIKLEGEKGGAVDNANLPLSIQADQK